MRDAGRRQPWISAAWSHSAQGVDRGAEMRCEWIPHQTNFRDNFHQPDGPRRMARLLAFGLWTEQPCTLSRGVGPHMSAARALWTSRYGVSHYRGRLTHRRTTRLTSHHGLPSTRPGGTRPKALLRLIAPGRSATMLRTTVSSMPSLVSNSGSSV